MHRNLSPSFQVFKYFRITGLAWLINGFFVLTTDHLLLVETVVTILYALVHMPCGLSSIL
jgi:hypothetical protein